METNEYTHTETIHPKDLSAPAGPTDEIHDITVRNKMQGVVRFSRNSRYAFIILALIVALGFAYGFGIFGGGGNKNTGLQAKAPLTERGSATNDTADTTIDNLADNGPKTLPVPGHNLPPLNNGTPPPTSNNDLASQMNTPNKKQDSLGDALQNANTPTAPPLETGPAPNYTYAPTASNPNNGGSVPNPGQVSLGNPNPVNTPDPAVVAAAKAADDAKKSQIFIGGDNRGQPTPLPSAGSNLTDRNAGSEPVSQNGSLQVPTPGPNTNSTPGTSQRLEFANGQNARPPYLLSEQQNPVGKYELWAGALMPAQLDTGINTQMPGPVRAHIQKDVYDSKTGQTLLIPKGSMLIGRYNSVTQNGIPRVQVVWDRLFWPDGRYISLQEQIGAEPEGQAGLYADINDHRGRIIGASLFTALLSSGAQILANKGGAGGAQTATVTNTGQVVGQTVGGQLAQTGQTFIDKQIQIPDEMTVPKGKPFIVLLDRTIVLQPWRYQR